MAAYLSDEWLAGPHDAVAVAAAAAGIDLNLLHVVTGGPQKELRFASYEDGEPDLTFTCAHADGLALAKGEVSPNVAYMRGRLKVTGHTGLLLQLLAACEGEAYREASAQVAARTDS